MTNRRSRNFFYTPPGGDLKILYQDDDLVVFSKPAGLLSVPGKDPAHGDCMEARARRQFPEALIVHRLDMDTSGVFLMARNKQAQANLGKQFERRKVEKTYIARIWGMPQQDNGHIDQPLRCDWPNRPRQMVCYEHGKPATTLWQVLEKGGNRALVSLKPETGRSHQLRVHMAEMGHPIIGDPFYAHDDAFQAGPRLMLHAVELSFYRPADGELITIQDPVPF